LGWRWMMHDRASHRSHNIQCRNTYLTASSTSFSRSSGMTMA
jgi:hypothetical protein